MTSRLGQRATSLLAAGLAAAAALAIIALLWSLASARTAPPPHQDTTTTTEATIRHHHHHHHLHHLHQQQHHAAAPDDGVEVTVDDGDDDSDKGAEVVHDDNEVEEEDEDDEGDGATELVRPVKVDPPPLHALDQLYDELRSGGGAQRPPGSNASVGPSGGHFRQAAAAVWDARPEYVVAAFGARLHLVLEHDARFLPAARLDVVHMWRNYTRRVRPPLRAAACYYTGAVQGQEQHSHVAVSLCGGMTGYIRAREGDFYIEPAEAYVDPAAATGTLHRIRRLGAPPAAGARCDTDTDWSPLDNMVLGQRRRRRRDTWTNHVPEGGSEELGRNREYFIETLVVVDKRMAEYHGSDERVTHYVLTLMAHVSLLFKDATIGNPISMAVVRIIILRERELVAPDAKYASGVSSTELLRQFCRFQSAVNAPGAHHDAALLLTREKICREPRKCGDTLGLAKVGAICDPPSSCAIVKDKGLPSSYTIAHELGHMLNIPHDDGDKCEGWGGGAGEAGVTHVMGHTMRNGTKPWLWSNCSKHYVTEFLESAHAHCLLDRPPVDLAGAAAGGVPRLPGEAFAGDEQCELMYGAGWVACSYMLSCEWMWCAAGRGRDEGCHSHSVPWADGTACGAGGWCRRGRCVARDRGALLPVAGGWGAWRAWGPCSRSCGGGVRSAARDCDSPRPRNGGPYCLGPSVRHASCNTRPCAASAGDFREQQCARFDGDPLDVPGLTRGVRWVPQYGGLPARDRCRLWCRVQHTNQGYPLAERVVDGTKCGPHTFDVCVAGACRPAGCDNRLGSARALDACGVCGGDGARCRTVRGAYNRSSAATGYVALVARIPRGASGLDVRQRAPHDSPLDGNYLALLDPDTGAYVLNGDYVIASFSKLLVYGGVPIEYSGSKAVVERLNSSTGIRLKKDLVVALLSVERLLPPDITYTYQIVEGDDDDDDNIEASEDDDTDHVPEQAEEGMWSTEHGTEAWTACSAVCDGERRAVPRCVRRADGGDLPEAACDAAGRTPAAAAAPRQPCNTQCRLAWRVRARHACSAHCGRGARALLHQCARLDVAAPADLAQRLLEGALPAEDAAPWAADVDDQHCAALARPPAEEPCEGACGPTRWHYTEWTPCSKACGGGVQRRGAQCMDEAGAALAEAACDGRERATERPCHVHKCPAWGLADWTPCSVTCGSGFRMRPLYCQEEGRVVAEAACDAAARPVVREACAAPRPCARWLPAAWAACSCAGHRQRAVRCVDAGDAALPAHHCSTEPRPPDTQPCPPPPHCTTTTSTTTALSQHIESNAIPTYDEYKYEWRSGPWSDCSRSCGGGFKLRNVACQSAAGEQQEAMCAAGRRPLARVSCNAQPCPAWHTGDWGACSAQCRRQRQVRCQDTAGAPLEDALCPLDTRPLDTMACPCPAPPEDSTTTTTTTTAVTAPRYRWRRGAWGACSARCGTGERVRSVACADTRLADVTVVDALCLGRRPRARRPCSGAVQRCPWAWAAGPWTQCTVSCGEGRRYRNVTCVGGAGDACDPAARPAHHERCLERYCAEPEFAWVAGPWAARCEPPCGPRARQTRRLHCRHRAGRRVPQRHCPRAARPARRRRCPAAPPRCTFRSCAHARAERALGPGDGDVHVALAGGAVVRLHCRGEREFLPLARAADNYAEVYALRLARPDACPHAGQRNASCACLPDQAPHHGLTHFSKLRFNITDMRIIGDDFTFARQVSGAPVAYGTAGDCYSRRPGCVQGRFSIDLAGTGLRVSPRAAWLAAGAGATHSVARHRHHVRLTGRCGGYCGSCHPDPRIGLLLEPLQ